MGGLMAERAELAAIYAGGAGRRMGGVDKGVLVVGGRPLWKIVTDRLDPQCDGVAIVSPAPPDWFAGVRAGYWIADMDSRGGPAGGLLAALRHLEREHGRDARLLTSPVDAPFLPADLFVKLEAARRKAGAPAAIVLHANRPHPVFGVWVGSCADDVAAAMREESSLRHIAARTGAVECEAWVDAKPDPFMNINAPEDLAAAEDVIRDL